MTQYQTVPNKEIENLNCAQPRIKDKFKCSECWKYFGSKRSRKQHQKATEHYQFIFVNIGFKLTKINLIGDNGSRGHYYNIYKIEIAQNNT